MAISQGALIYAAQAMRDRGFTAIQFLVADRLGQRNEWDANRYAGLLAADRQPDWVSHAGVKDFQDS
jgi:hypothetical protein